MAFRLSQDVEIFDTLQRAITFVDVLLVRRAFRLKDQPTLAFQ